MLLTYSLTLFFLLFPSESRPITSHHVTCHVTAVMCLFFVKKKIKIKIKKRNIKSKKIDKRKRKMFIVQAYHNIDSNLKKE